MKVRKYFVFLLLANIAAFNANIIAQETQEGENFTAPVLLEELRKNIVVKVQTLVPHEHGGVFLNEGTGFLIAPMVVITTQSILHPEDVLVPRGTRMSVYVQGRKIAAEWLMFDPDYGLAALILSEKVNIPSTLQFYGKKNQHHSGENYIITHSEVLRLPTTKDRVKNARGALEVDDSGAIRGIVWATLEKPDSEYVHFKIIDHPHVVNFIKDLIKKMDPPEPIRKLGAKPNANSA